MPEKISLDSQLIFEKQEKAPCQPWLAKIQS